MINAARDHHELRAKTRVHAPKVPDSDRFFFTEYNVKLQAKVNQNLSKQRLHRGHN